MAKTAIASQVLENQDKDGMLRRALERIIQLYTDKSHFVYELLQNAEDAGATKIKFCQYADKLIVLHDGHPFSVKNLQGLCDIGKSDKTDDLNQIGEFGVGFKSVYGICEKVELYSHPTEADIKSGFSQFAVEIRDFTHPIDIDDQEMEKGYTTKFVFPFSVGFTFSGFSTVDRLNEVLAGRLQNLGITTLLFMKNLQFIDYEIDLPDIKTSGSYLLEKKAISDHCSFVSAIGEGGKTGNEEISYMVFSRPVKGLQAGRSIDIAFAVVEKGNEEYEFISAKAPYISVYFPTETESKLKFIVQGPYRTTPNRSSVPSDDEDNISLARQTAKLLKDSVAELRDRGQADFSLLNILPVEENEFDSAPLFKCLYYETADMMKKDRMLLCKDGNYASSDEVKISRGAGFAEILTDDLLTELLNDGTEYHWLPTFLTETNKEYKNLYDFLTNELDIEVIRPENLRNSINENPSFMTRRNDEWLVKFYNMYSSVAAAFSKQRGGSNMLTAEFVKTSSGKFVAPYRKSDGIDQNSFFYRGYEDAAYLPNVFLPTKNSNEMEEIAFVDEKIFEQCKTFFIEILGLQKPNEYEFFIRDYKRRCEEGVPFSDDQLITDLKRLIKYRTNADYKDEVDNLIQKYMVVKCIKDGKVVYINPKKEKVLFSVNSENMSIEQYYNHICSYPYVITDFYELEDIDRDILKQLGVVEDISLGEDKTSGEYFTGKQGKQPSWNTNGSFRWKLSLDKLGEVLEYISCNPDEPDSMAKSSFIFRFLQQHENSLTGVVLIGGNTPNLTGAFSDIITTLRQDGPKHKYYGMNWTGKWLYTESGELVSQKEISRKELNPQLYGEVQLDSKLYEYLGFMKSEEEQLEDAEKDYEQLSDETKNHFFEIELMRRYGISISDLDESFGGSAEERKTDKKKDEDVFEFPSSRVKNWDSLRKHAAEVLVFASPVKYEYKIRKIRISKPSAEIDAYLRGMYKVDRAYKYACQMCHDAYAQFERCQISTDMEKELDAMYLCLCPNCATEYRNMRSNKAHLEKFVDSIRGLKDSDITGIDPVKVEFGDESIWFTQTHIAEIRELIALKEEADKYKESESLEKDVNSRDSDGLKFEKNENDSKDVYKEYVGKRIHHKVEGYGVVTAYDGKYIDVVFEKGSKAGKTAKYSLETCLSKGLIKVL